MPYMNCWRNSGTHYHKQSTAKFIECDDPLCIYGYSLEETKYGK